MHTKPKILKQEYKNLEQPQWQVEVVVGEDGRKFYSIISYPILSYPFLLCCPSLHETAKQYNTVRHVCGVVCRSIKESTPLQQNILQSSSFWLSFYFANLRAWISKIRYLFILLPVVLWSKKDFLQTPKITLFIFYQLVVVLDFFL